MNMDEIDKRHGGPYDRGNADSYYGRRRRPHYFKGGSYKTEEIPEYLMSKQQIAEYNLGFDENEANQNFKDWG